MPALRTGDKHLYIHNITDMNNIQRMLHKMIRKL